MKRLITITAVAAILGAGLGTAFAAAEPPRVPPKGLEGPDIRAKIPPKGIEGPDFRHNTAPTPKGLKGPDVR